MDVLAQTARAHLKRAKALGDSLDTRISVMVKAADDWTLNEDMRRDLKTITECIQHAGKGLENALEAKAKINAGLTEAQLLLQFQAELVKAAPLVSNVDWDLMVDARRKAGKHV